MAKIIAHAVGLLYICLQLPSMVQSANFSSPTWCPESHQQLELKGRLFRVCEPKSCNNLTSNTTKLHCESLSEHFQKCQKVVTPGDRYIPDDNGTIWNRLDNSSIQQGDYMLMANKFIICASDTSDSLDSVPDPNPCMSFRVSQTGYQFQSNNSVFVTSVNATVSEGYFKTDSNGSELQVCYPSAHFKQLLQCKIKTKLDNTSYILQPNLVIQLQPDEDYTFQIGHYLLHEDSSFVVYCNKDGQDFVRKRTHTFYLYGVVSVISAVCLLLVLVVHQFYPRLNYHAKSILCLAFSLLMMYIAICVRHFSLGGHFHLVSNIIIFAIQYIFGLSSFLWLNVLAFDLWRVFSRVRGAVSTEASRRTGKRWFWIKCIYAWGIPVILCIPIICLHFNRDVQRTLHIYVDFVHSPWMTAGLGMHLTFYTPVVIILVCNCIFYGLTVRNIIQARNEANVLHMHIKVNIKLFNVYLKLFVIMGLSWFAEVISYYIEGQTHEAVWHILDLINLMQGVFIFIVYVCKKKTLKVIKKKFNPNSVKAGDKDTSSTPISEKSRKVSTISMSTINRNTNENNH